MIEKTNITFRHLQGEADYQLMILEVGVLRLGVLIPKTIFCLPWAEEKRMNTEKLASVA